MSMFGDYKAYKKYQPQYDTWKFKRDLAEAKRLEYLKQHPDEKNPEDIKRAKTLIRAIDVMDDYSQKRAQDMEVATETVIGLGLELAMFGGGILGVLASRIKPINKFLASKFNGNKNAKELILMLPAAIGAAIGTLGALPLFAWGAKAEVAASRKGRFEAMYKELNDPKGFAVLTDEQEQKAREIAPHIRIEEDKNKVLRSFNKSMESIKEVFVDSKEYKQQKNAFNAQILVDEQHFNDKMTAEEIEEAKKDQQILTKLVEKIDIASQDYAENAELAAQTAFITVAGFSVLFSIGLEKILNACKVKSAGKISTITKCLGILATIGTSIATAQVSKEASRVGRYKIKKELQQNPEQLIYVSDEKTGEIKDVQIKPHKKPGMFKFLQNAIKDTKEYKKYKKNEAKDEKRFYKAIEMLNLTPEQIKEAERLQKNTFKTFSKVDDNTQKYSESVEARGRGLSTPLTTIFSFIGAGIGMPFLMRKSKNSLEMTENFAKYIGVVLLSSIPSIAINAHITKEQKKASRVANMVAINEMQDYRSFKG